MSMFGGKQIVLMAEATCSKSLMRTGKERRDELGGGYDEELDKVLGIFWRST